MSTCSQPERMWLNTKETFLSDTIRRIIFLSGNQPLDILEVSESTVAQVNTLTNTMPLENTNGWANRHLGSHEPVHNWQACSLFKQFIRLLIRIF